MNKLHLKKNNLEYLYSFVIFGLLFSISVENVLSSPLYSRQYKISCSACHSAPPQLNIYGSQFRQTNSLPSWESNTSIDIGDENTAVPKIFPFSIRSLMLARLRKTQHISDQTNGNVSHNSTIDSQTPYFIKLISSAVLTENISFYFDSTLQAAEKNGSFMLSDTWVRYRFDDGLSTNITLGQYPISDIIMDQDARLSIKQYQIYTQSNLTLDRGMKIGINVSNYTFSVGLSNGADTKNIASSNSAGLGRSDSLFDHNNRKSIYGHLSRRFSHTKIGVFSQVSQQFAPTGILADTPSDRVSFQYTTGFDIQGFPNHKINWIIQVLWNRWHGFLDENVNHQWFGGFININYRATDELSYSLLYNYTNAYDFKNSGTIYEGLSSNVITTTISYYFRSNVRGILEVSMDFLPADNDDDFIGHETKEDALILGIDISY